jgi:hypothetical protein
MTAVRAEYRSRIQQLIQQNALLESHVKREWSLRQEVERLYDVALQRQREQKRKLAAEPVLAEPVVRATGPGAGGAGSDVEVASGDEAMLANMRALRELARRNDAFADEVLLARANFLDYLRAILKSDVPGDIFVSRHTFKGFLTKLGDRNRSWRERWFVVDLANRMLTYYADDRPGTRESGTIPLRSIERVVMPASPLAKLEHLLLVVTAHRTYQLRAPTEAACVCWCRLLQVVAAETV